MMHGARFVYIHAENWKRNSTAISHGVIYKKKQQKEPKLYRGKVSARLYKDGPIKSTETRPVGMYSRRLPYYRAKTQKKDKKPRIYANLLIFLFRATVP